MPFQIPGWDTAQFNRSGKNDRVFYYSRIKYVLEVDLLYIKVKGNPNLKCTYGEGQKGNATF